MELFSCLSPERCYSVTPGSVPDGEDHLKVIMGYFSGYFPISFLLNYQVSLGNSIFGQLTAFEDIAYVYFDIWNCSLIETSNLGLGHPNGHAFNEDGEFLFFRPMSGPIVMALSQSILKKAFEDRLV